MERARVVSVTRIPPQTCHPDRCGVLFKSTVDKCAPPRGSLLALGARRLQGTPYAHCSPGLHGNVFCMVPFSVGLMSCESRFRSVRGHVPFGLSYLISFWDSSGVIITVKGAESVASCDPTACIASAPSLPAVTFLFGRFLLRLPPGRVPRTRSTGWIASPAVRLPKAFPLSC